MALRATVDAHLLVDEWVRPMLDEFKAAVPALASLELTLTKAAPQRRRLVFTAPAAAPLVSARGS